MLICFHGILPYKMRIEFIFITKFAISKQISDNRQYMLSTCSILVDAAVVNFALLACAPCSFSLCSMHITKINKSRCTIAHKQLESQAETAETLLDDLEHYSSTLYNNTRNDRKYTQITESAAFLAGLKQWNIPNQLEDQKHKLN